MQSNRSGNSSHERWGSVMNDRGPLFAPRELGGAALGDTATHDRWLRRVWDGDRVELGPNQW